MAASSATTDARPSWGGLVVWMSVAAIGGVGCLFLPPYVGQGGLKNPAYGWPLLPFVALAWANLRFATTMGCFGVLGLLLGFAHPRHWLLLAGAGIVAPAVLLAVNIMHDWAHDPTSHNLFPFEFLAELFLGLPLFVGLPIGILVRRLLGRRPVQTNGNSGID